MQRLRWLWTSIVSLFLGASLVGYLTVHPIRMSRYLVLACSSFFALLASLTGSYRGLQRIGAAGVALGSFLAGYTVMTKRFLAREDERPVPEIARAKDDPGLGHTAVVYFTHGEPETYDPIGWINQFQEFDEQGIRFVPLLARPWFVYQLRNKYLRVGKSGHRQMHQQMLARLEQAYRAEGDSTTRFYLSFLDDDPRPDAAVIQALNDGASRIIVSEVFLTVSNHTAEGKELIEDLGIEDYGVDIRYTGPLWQSETLKRMFVERANRYVDGTEKDKVGILLVGHGQPDEWDREWYTETQQEIAFRESVLDLLEGDGFKRENLSLAWMEFKEPEPADKVQEFASNGASKLLYFSAAISADALHSQYDVPALVEQAKVPPDFEMINLGAWNDDPLVIQAIKERIDGQMGEGK
jgi:sirohydrochlorin ferrochelatase